MVLIHRYLQMYEFPVKIQEQMYGAMSACLRDADELAAYKKREHIRSEEFIYLLARAYTVLCEFNKARSLADELSRSSKKGKEAAEKLNELIICGEDVMDDNDIETEELYPWSEPWDYGWQAEEKQKPYVRTQPKISRNAPCPCGSGKKYKHCCGK
ncbi:SEC-C domain-containing protein [Ruminococcus sp. CLA-AA-H200]|uniref:SEC-C domain-containing protein n=1 Tax=Ruminococcus turbiniformis TaxID=2881258 RepID=A0ABS8G2E1_9FIRM|nr:SEC-C metal-binding domain-containing protein [Ruminococcus turbiniformis]MCC2256044.1 SEC-C domain-containing protein [Ruminococcus turbiniformis]